MQSDNDKNAFVTMNAIMHYQEEFLLMEMKLN
jgi:hypothetical protein